MGRGVLLLGLGLSFLLWGLLLPCTDCSPEPSWGYAVYEVVIPKKLGSRTEKASQDEVSYIISIQGVNYTIHLRQKDFVIKNFPVFTRDSQGEIVVEHPHVPADCYYHGYVEGIPDSAVTLTTCSGLRGLLQIGNSSYSIEPLAASSMAEHLLLRREDVVPGTVMYKMPSDSAHFPGPRTTTTRQFQPRWHTRYLELLVVVDKEGFDAFGRSITNVTLEVIEIINLVDGLFYSFHLRVLITALEVWVEKNPISVTKNITKVLHNFDLWRKQQSLMYAVHDMGCLFASMDFDQGYVLGMEHDDRYCRCGNTSKCIMSAHGTVNYQFSNCSKKHYFNFIASGQGFCLNNAPELRMTFALQRCGNGVLEVGEECDCGSEAQSGWQHGSWERWQHFQNLLKGH
nr:PREDICTED: disintegrin and metalloproteinase domain-containing protein 2-like [Phalacrocorax carbo]